MDKLSEMEAFINVVDQGGFTDAADKLSMSKSAVSKHVSSLETRLGVRLLNRTTRRVSPTEIGLAYYDRARKVLMDAAAADEFVTAMQSSPRGTLRVSAPVSFGTRHLADIVTSFLKEYPDVTLDMVLNDSFVNLVQEGFDIAIRIGYLTESSLMARKLADTQTALVASPAYLAAAGTPTRLEDLSQHKLLQYSQSSPSNSWRMVTRNGEERQIRVGSNLIADNGDVLLAGAIGGLGIAFLPCFFIAEPIRQGKLVTVLDDHPQPPRGIHAVYPPGRYVQPKTRAFIEHLAGAIKTLKATGWS